MKAKHQEEIESSRVGGFGGSDAKLFYKIGLKGLDSLSNTDKKRIAVAKGLLEYKPIKQTVPMLKGHEFEDWFEKNTIYEGLKREVKFSKQMAKNFDTFFHADFSSKHAQIIIELKCVENPENAEKDYAEQLQWQLMISGYDVFLKVCDSNCKTFEEGHKPTFQITPDKEIIATLKKGIKLLDEAWNTIDLTIGEEWEEGDLMFWEKPEVVAMANYLKEIKALEARAEEQREKVLQIMLQNNIRSLASDYYSITLVPESTTNTFDKKKLLTEHPEINEADYTKTSPKKAYIKVILK